MFPVSDLFCADKDTNVAVNSFLFHLAKLEISHSTSQAITDCGLLVEPKLLLEVALAVSGSGQEGASGHINLSR